MKRLSKTGIGFLIMMLLIVVVILASLFFPHYEIGYVLGYLVIIFGVIVLGIWIWKKI